MGISIDWLPAVLSDEVSNAPAQAGVLLSATMAVG
jgi:hypothetical protein